MFDLRLQASKTSIISLSIGLRQLLRHADASITGLWPTAEGLKADHSDLQ
jgi:hypothetical protein